MSLKSKVLSDLRGPCSNLAQVSAQDSEWIYFDQRLIVKPQHAHVSSKSLPY